MLPGVYRIKQDLFGSKHHGHTEKKSLVLWVIYLLNNSKCWKMDGAPYFTGNS